jgi:transcriptional regulator with XRE-family HTH domain
MAVAVYPRLDELLRARKLSVAELERQIERRFGLAVDPKTLYRLTSAEPVQRADLEIAGAAAAVLGVGLDDLFEVRATPIDEAEVARTDLSPDESRRLAELFDRQARGALSTAEQAELEALVADYGRRLHERRLRELAERRGVPVEQARREVAAHLDEALAWWQAFATDPEGRRLVAARARGRRARAAR